MSQIEPNAPPGFTWLFLDLDVPTSRDFIRAEEARVGRAMSNEEAITYIAAEFNFMRFRAKQIVDTIKGETVGGA